METLNLAQWCKAQGIVRVSPVRNGKQSMVLFGMKPDGTQIVINISKGLTEEVTVGQRAKTLWDYPITEGANANGESRVYLGRKYNPDEGDVVPQTLEEATSDLPFA